MKIKKLLALFAVVTVTASCSNDDPEPSLENVAVSLSGQTQVIQAPTALMTNQDAHAQMASGWVAMANGMSASLALFTPPAGAKKSTDAIVPVNGRVAGATLAVYTWSDPNYGSVAYQIRDVTDKYTFELFYKGTQDTGWYRYLYAQEMKDRSSGYMVMYDAWGFVSSTRKEELIRWDWTRTGDEFVFKIKDSDEGFNFTLTINTKTKAGSVVYYEGAAKLYEIIWDAQGKGTWKEYQNNTVISQGSW